MSIEFAAPLEDRVRDVVEIDLLRPRWMQAAACRGQGLGAWFPTDEVGGLGDLGRRVCAGCPVRRECLDYAVAVPIRHGMWGGLSARERSALTNRRYRVCGN